MIDSPPKRDFGLLDYAIAVLKWRKWLIVNFITVGVISAGISLVLPKWFLSTSTIMPPKQDMGLFGLSRLANSIPFGGMGLDFLKGGDMGYTYLAILQSRTVLDRLIDDYNLLTVYEFKENERDKARKAVAENLDFNLNKEGTITISVLDKNPNRAAGMANALVHYLDSLNVILNIEKARNNRIFIEQRFTQNKLDLKDAEETLKTFQENYGAISLSAQAEAAIKSAADIQARIMFEEVELGVKKNYLTATHEEIVQGKNKVAELRKKLSEVQYGNHTGAANGNSKSTDILPPLADVPELGLQYARHLRELEVQKTLYELLIQQYELAKIEEARTIPTVQVLDRAIPPERKYKPKRSLIVVFSALSTTMIMVMFILIIERIRLLQAEDPERYAKLANVLPGMKAPKGGG
ncbi:MAG: GumC family protein [bacterium]